MSFCRNLLRLFTSYSPFVWRSIIWNHKISQEWGGRFPLRSWVLRVPRRWNRPTGWCNYSTGWWNRQLESWYHSTGQRNRQPESWNHSTGRWAWKVLLQFLRIAWKIQPISARQMATDADNAATDVIFPQCRKKPYCLRTYSNLLSLLSNPDSHKFTGSHAPKS